MWGPQVDAALANYHKHVMEAVQKRQTRVLQRLLELNPCGQETTRTYMCKSTRLARDNGGSAACMKECKMLVTAITDGEERELEVLSWATVHNVMMANFLRHVDEVCLGHDAVPPGVSFEECGIEDGARLSVSFHAKATVEEFVADVIELNPHLTRRELMRFIYVDPEDASRVLGNVHWDRRGIVALPESIGDITVAGIMYLGKNRLCTLPQSFGGLTVGRHLILGDNNLLALPDSFGRLTVGGDVYLDHNNLQCLPKTFGHLAVGGSLSLNSNDLQCLPASFGRLRVGKDLYLGNNSLANLPVSFEGLCVGGTVYMGWQFPHRCVCCERDADHATRGRNQ